MRLVIRFHWGVFLQLGSFLQIFLGMTDEFIKCPFSFYQWGVPACMFLSNFIICADSDS